MTSSAYPNLQVKQRSKKHTRKKQCSIIPIRTPEIKKRKQNSRKSMKPTKSSEIKLRRQIMTNLVLQKPILLLGEGILSDEHEEHSQDRVSPQDSKIYSHSLDEDEGENKVETSTSISEISSEIWEVRDKNEEIYMRKIRKKRKYNQISML